MGIGGDPDDLRHHATVLRGWADSVEDEADRLRSGEDVEWASTAGDAFRHLLEGDVGRVTGVAGRLRDAAERLDDLAATLTDRQQWLEDVRAKVEAGIDTAENLVESGARKVWDGAGDVAHRLGGLL